MATTRRTAKISKAERLSKTTMPYALVHMSHIDAEAQLVRCTAKCDMTITGHNGAKITLRAGEEFYLARSDSVADGWYVIANGRCSCPALKPCKHEKALAAKQAESTPQERSIHHRCGHDSRLLATASEVAERAEQLCLDCRQAELHDEFARECAEAEKIFAAPMRVVERAYRFVPQVQENGAYRDFTGENGKSVAFGEAEMAEKYIAEDSDEHRQAVIAEEKQREAVRRASISAWSAASSSKQIAAGLDVKGDLYGRPFNILR